MKNVKNFNAIAMLEYQAQRYQVAGNGPMCQSLNAKIRKLVAESNNCSAKN